MNFLKRSDNIESQDFEDESLLLNLETGFYFRLNEVGGFIWNFLDGKHSKNDIIKLVAGEFNVSQESAERDLDKFIGELQNESLISVCDNNDE